jgi:tetratricopeptide (TPR) repeat protein
VAASTRLKERLSALRSRNSSVLAPLWIEESTPVEALRQLSERGDTLSRLQEARFLRALREEQKAWGVLEALGDLPAGLEAVRQSIRGPAPAPQVLSEEQGRAEGEGRNAMVSKTLAELYASQGDAGTAVSMYRQILSQNPGDERARVRLRELLSAEQVDPLHAWLERVRLWRGALHV